MGIRPSFTAALRHGLVLSAVVMAGASSAHAMSCGDIVRPGGTARLTGDLVCARSPALTVEGPVVVDLQGFTLTCALDDDGNLAGTGIRVIGSEAQVRNGKIANCHRGVRVEGGGRHLLKRLTVTSAPGLSGGDPVALLLASNRNRILRNLIRGYAGEAVRLDGANGNMLKRNRAIGNADHGFRVRSGERNLFFRNTAQGNGGEGFRSQDRDNRFESNTAAHNGDEGIRLRDAAAQNNRVTGNDVHHNGLSPCNPLADVPDVNPGIAVTREARNNKIKGNKVRNNCIGIAVEDGSKKNKMTKNDVSNSRMLDVIDGNSHCANNDWRRNRFKTSASGPFPPGIPFAPCLRFGNPLESVADKGEDIVKDAGSAVEDLADSLF